MGDATPTLSEIRNESTRPASGRPGPDRRSRARSGTLDAFARRCLPVLLLAAAVVLGACEREAPNVGITMSDVNETPEAFFGTLITVSGEIGEVWSPGVFALGGDDFDDRLIVVSTDSVAVVPGRSADAPFVADDVVQVTGYLHPYDEVEGQYGLSLPADVAEEAAGGPVLVASRSASVYADVVVTPRSGRELLTDLAAVAGAANAAAYDGRPARFSGEVGEMVGGDVFRLTGGGGASLLVVLNAMALPDSVSVAEGERWTVSGTLRELPAEAILQADWSLASSQLESIADDDLYLHATRATRD